MSAVFNANDWLTSQSTKVDAATATTQTWNYDDNGAETNNATENGSTGNGWSHEGHLLATQTKDAVGTVNGGAQNLFDGAGNRVAQKVSLSGGGTKTTSYLMDSDTSYAHVIEESAPNMNDSSVSKLQARYVWGEDLAPLAMWRKMPDGALKLFFFVSDDQESVRQLTDTAGIVTDSYFYDAWGNGLAGGSGSTINPFRYTGQQLDADGKYYMRARFYNPAQGRFLGQDALLGHDDDPGSLHRYLYANNAPTYYSDPSGLNFRQSMGYAAEDAVRALYSFDPLYAMDVAMGDVLFGDQTGEGLNPTLKPDVFNTAQKHWMEVKPWSWNGIREGAAQWAEYDVNFSPLGYAPNTSFLMLPAIVSVSGQYQSYSMNTNIMLFNIFGVVFWRELKKPQQKDWKRMEEQIRVAQNVANAAQSARAGADILDQDPDWKVKIPPSQLPGYVPTPRPSTSASWSIGFTSADAMTAAQVAGIGTVGVGATYGLAAAMSSAMFNASRGLA